MEGDLDTYFAEDAMTEALARYYEQRAEDLRREAEVGHSNGFVRFLKSFFGRVELQNVMRPALPKAEPIFGQTNSAVRGGIFQSGLALLRTSSPARPNSPSIRSGRRRGKSASEKSLSLRSPETLSRALTISEISDQLSAQARNSEGLEAFTSTGIAVYPWPVDVDCRRYTAQRFGSDQVRQRFMLSVFGMGSGAFLRRARQVNKRSERFSSSRPIDLGCSSSSTARSL